MTKHHLKTWPKYFKEIVHGRKTFELRKNDRDFRTGDNLVLEEWNPETRSYTGNQITKRVGFMIQGEWGLAGYVCAMSLLRPIGIDPHCTNCDGLGGGLNDGSCEACWDWQK